MAETGEFKLGGIQQYEGDPNSPEMQDLARFAVEDYNKKQNACLEFQKNVNIKKQVVEGFMFYITMEVNEGDKKKVCEAKVWVKAGDNSKQVEEFKLIGETYVQAG